MSEETPPAPQHEMELRLKTEDPEALVVSRRELALELRALKRDMQLIIVASVGLNQFLNSVNLSSVVAGASAVGIVGAKVVLAYFAK